MPRFSWPKWPLLCILGRLLEMGIADGASSVSRVSIYRKRCHDGMEESCKTHDVGLLVYALCPSTGFHVSGALYLSWPRPVRLVSNTFGVREWCTALRDASMSAWAFSARCLDGCNLWGSLRGVHSGPAHQLGIDPWSSCCPTWIP